MRQSLLAILTQGPCYGYQLRGEFHRRTGSTWPLNVGQIYNTLDRLERDGLVEKADHGEVDQDSSGQIYYRITDAGSAEATGWLSSAVEQSAATRDELAIKLAIAVTLPGVSVAQVIGMQRSATLQKLQEFTQSKNTSNNSRNSENLARLLILDSLIFQAEAELRWLDHCEEQLALAYETGLAGPMPLRAEVPKRGRPSKLTTR